MTARERQIEQARELHAHYTRTKLAEPECGLPDDAVSEVHQMLFNITQGGPGTWRPWCDGILDSIAPFRSHDGLQELVEFAERYASCPGPGDSPSPQQAGAVSESEEAAAPGGSPDDDGSGPAAIVDAEVPNEDVPGDTQPEAADPKVKDTQNDTNHGGDNDDNDGRNAPSSRSVVPEAIALSQITVDSSVQARESIDESAVEDYAEAMKAGQEFLPVVVFHDPKTKDYLLADGFHRIKAATLAGHSEIRADVHTGTRRDAILYAVGANTKHGVRRSNKDKRRAVKMLLDDQEWNCWSNHEIADHAGVSPPLVGKVRNSLSGKVFQMDGPSEASDVPSGNDGKRLVKRGDSVYEMDTGRIGKGRGGDVGSGLESETAAPDGCADALGGPMAGEGSDTILGKPEPPPATLDNEPSGGEVFVASIGALESWAAKDPEKRGPVVAEQLLEVREALDREYPGFYSRVMTPAMKQRAEREAVAGEKLDGGSHDEL
jgi:hypothetical protein